MLPVACVRVLLYKLKEHLSLIELEVLRIALGLIESLPATLRSGGGTTTATLSTVTILITARATASRVPIFRVSPRTEARPTRSLLFLYVLLSIILIGLSRIPAGLGDILVTGATAGHRSGHGVPIQLSVTTHGGGTLRWRRAIQPYLCISLFQSAALDGPPQLWLKVPLNNLFGKGTEILGTLSLSADYPDASLELSPLVIVHVDMVRFGVVELGYSDHARSL
jgi:hypothetical protein